MEALGIYLLKSAGVLAVFCLTYHFLLRRLTFFQSNRFFLLFGLIASVVFPLIEITQTVYMEQPAMVPESGFTTVQTPMAIALEQTPVVDESWWQAIELNTLLYVFYAMLALFFLGKMTLELLSLSKLIRSGEISKRGRFLLVSLSRKLTPFSFFHYICFTAKDDQKEEFDLILNHEKVHASQWHSLDVILSTIYRAAFWFNPLAWWVKKQITENLEFIADAEAKAANTSSISYERTLLSIMATQPQPALANNFFTPTIKKRIVMLQKETTARWHAYKYALILPVIVLFLYSFNVVEEIEYLDSKVDTENAPALSSEVITIFSSTTLSELAAISERINATHNYTVEFSQISRDKNGAITKISIAATFPKQKKGNNFMVGDGTRTINEFVLKPEAEQIQVTGIDDEVTLTLSKKGTELNDIPNLTELDTLKDEISIFKISSSTTDSKIDKINQGIKQNSKHVTTIDRISKNSNDEIMKVWFKVFYKNLPENIHSFTLGNDKDPINNILIYSGQEELNVIDDRVGFKYQVTPEKGLQLDMDELYSSTIQLHASTYVPNQSDYVNQKQVSDEILVIKITSSTTKKELEKKVKKLKEYNIDMSIQKAKYKRGKLVHLKYTIDDNKGYSSTQNYNTTDGINNICITRTKKGGEVDWKTDNCNNDLAYSVNGNKIANGINGINNIDADQLEEQVERSLALAQQGLNTINIDSLMNGINIDLSSLKPINLDSLYNLSELKAIDLDSIKKSWNSNDKWSFRTRVAGDSLLKDNIISLDSTTFSGRAYYFDEDAVGSAGSPIVIINGKTYTESELARLPADNIKSVNVLKGQAAVALYGSKGKNGAIVLENDGEVIFMDSPQTGRTYSSDTNTYSYDKNGSSVWSVETGAANYSTTASSSTFTGFSREDLEEFGEKVRERGYEFKIRTFRAKGGKVTKLKLDFAGSTYTIVAENEIERLKFQFYNDNRNPIMTSVSR